MTEATKIDYSENGKCNVGKCQARCCTSVLPLSDYEISRIKKLIKAKNIKCTRRHIITPEAETTGILEENNICPFLTENHRCAIYSRAPEVCTYFHCHGSKGNFSHKDKHIVHMWATFFPEEDIGRLPDIKHLDVLYQNSKKNALNKGRN